jgi:hypothetical protein
MGEEVTLGNEDLTSLGLTSASFEGSCGQDLQYITLHTFAFNCFPNMLISLSGFPERLDWVS